MLDQVEAYIHRHHLIAQGDLVIVAVSGGPDSVALLHLLHRLSAKLKIRLHLFHLDHGLRGEESAEEARYARSLAVELGLTSTVVGLGPEVLKRQSGSLQANARAIRYQELIALAHRLGASKVATGHNRDDQAETVLMRLMRGAGARGLAGIPPMRAEDGIAFIRPLLDLSRNEIEAYCREHQLSPRHDPSNQRPDYLRNQIRLELLPLLAERYNPAIGLSLATVAAILQEEEQLLESLTVAALTRCQIEGLRDSAVTLDGDQLLSEPLAISRRVVRLAAMNVIGQEFELNLTSVTRVLDAVARKSGTQRLDLNGGLQVLVEYGRCRFWRARSRTRKLMPAEWSLPLSGQVDIVELALVVELELGGVPAGPLEAAFDLDRLPGPLTIRFRRPGDRIWPVGMAGSKKLQDILVDAKAPQRIRDRVPVLTAGSEVLWIIGYRLDRRFLANSASVRTLLVRIAMMASDG